MANIEPETPITVEPQEIPAEPIPTGPVEPRPFSEPEKEAPPVLPPLPAPEIPEKVKAPVLPQNPVQPASIPETEHEKKRSGCGGWY